MFVEFIWAPRRTFLAKYVKIWPYVVRLVPIGRVLMVVWYDQAPSKQLVRVPARSTIRLGFHLRLWWDEGVTQSMVPQDCLRLPCKLWLVFITVPSVAVLPLLGGGAPPLGGGAPPPRWRCSPSPWWWWWCPSSSSPSPPPAPHGGSGGSGGA